MKKYLLILAVFLCLFQNVKAQAVPDPIDLVEESCLMAVDMEDLVGQVDCYTNSLNAWQKVMDDSYESLMALPDKDIIAKIKSGQEAWLKYSEIENENIITLIGGSVKGDISPMVAQDQKDIVRVRAIQLQNYANAFTP